jgi:outer membrane protein OmpA-like peptidoglycan-associated protein
MSTEDRLYWLIQSRLEEVKLQVAVEMGVFANSRLHEDLFNQSEGLGVSWTEEELAERIAKWSQFDPNASLPSIPFPDWSGQSPTDFSALPGRTTSYETGMDANQALLERIISLLEAHDVRIMTLEGAGGRNPEGTRRGFNFSDYQGSNGLRPPSQVPALASIGLPDAFDIRFGPGSASLGLNAQMQLSEVMELMGRYPELRVVCTGHADSAGDRTSNVQLSKRRAQAARSYLLQSGVQPERVLMNFFGEDRSMGVGAADRRVEVAFFAN